MYGEEGVSFAFASSIMRTVFCSTGGRRDEGLLDSGESYSSSYSKYCLKLDLGIIKMLYSFLG